MGATSVLRATAPSELKPCFMFFLESLDAGVSFRIEAHVVVVFVATLILADHPNAALECGIRSVEVLSFGKLADNLL